MRACGRRSRRVAKPQGRERAQVVDLQGELRAAEAETKQLRSRIRVARVWHGFVIPHASATHEDGAETAQEKNIQVTRGELEDLRSCPKLVHMMFREPKSGQHLAHFGLIEPFGVQTGPNVANS